MRPLASDVTPTFASRDGNEGMRSGVSSYVRLGTASIVVAGVLLLPLMAAAQAGVEWSAPAECPSAREAEAEIAELVQRDLRTLPGDAHAQVELRRIEPGLLEARVAVHAGRHVREHVLRDSSCAALTHAAALVVALALDPNAAPARPEKQTSAAPPARAVDAAQPTGASPANEAPASPVDAAVAVPSQPAEVSPAGDAPASPVDAATAVPTQPAEAPPPRAAEPARELSPNPAREPTPTPAPEPEPEPDSLSEPEPPRPVKLAGFVGVAAGLTAGIVPHLAPTVALGAGLALDALVLALRLGFTPEQHAALTDFVNAGGRVSLAYAAFETGARARAQNLEFPLLAGIESGFFSSRGDVPDSHTRRPAWLAACVSGGVAYTWSQRWRLGLRVDGLVALLRPRFALDVGAAAPDVFYRPQRIGTRLYLAFDVVFE